MSTVLIKSSTENEPQYHTNIKTCIHHEFNSIYRTFYKLIHYVLYCGLLAIPLASFNA